MQSSSDPVLWPRPLGGSNVANLQKQSSKQAKKLNGTEKLQETVFNAPITLPSKKNQFVSLDKIGVKKVEKRSKSKGQQETQSSFSQCGCQSTKHPFIGNCISCGRIYCEAEGPFNHLKHIPCYICDGIVLPPMSADEISKYDKTASKSTILAYQQKDKLLIFDKENAKRTQVLDAQADYYDTATWLTEEEKKAIDEKERRRHEKYKVSNRKIRIAYDVAGRKLVQVDSDSEDEISTNVTVFDHQSNILGEGLYRGTDGMKPPEKEPSLNSDDSARTENDVRYSSGFAVNALANEESKAGIIYRKLHSKYK